MLEFNNLSVKIIGPKIGAKPSAPSGELIDGDGDGKCQEESGKWVPCPPGVALAKKIKAIRDKAAEKAKKIADAAEADLPNRNIQEARNFYPEDFVRPDEMDWYANYEADNPQPDEDDYEDRDDYVNAVAEWEDEQILQWEEYVSDIENQGYEKLAAIFNGKFKDANGRELEIIVGTVETGEYGDLTMTGSIYDPAAGRTVADFQRSFMAGTGEVHHDLLRVRDSEKGSGIGSAFNARNEILYRAMHMNSITLSGAGGQGWDGVVHWPRNGFDWQDPTSKDQFLSIVSQSLTGREDRFTPEERTEIIQLLEQARQQSLYDTERVTAGDFLHLSPALTQYFKDNARTIHYRRDL